MSNSTQKSAIDSIWVAAIKTLKLQTESTCRMRGETMKGKSKKSTYSTTFGVDPILIPRLLVAQKKTP